MKRFWISWEEHVDTRPEKWPLHDNIIGVWCSGEGEGYWTMVALVQAKDAKDVGKLMLPFYPGISEWRFFNEVELKWTPNDRFPVISERLEKANQILKGES